MSEAMQVESRAPFVIDNDQAAEWALRRIREARMEADMWEAHYQREAKKERERADETVAHMNALLEDYFRTVPHKKSKTQESYTLPSGKLVRKAQQPKYTINDEDACAWLDGHSMGDLVKMTVKADWAQLKKQVSVLADGTVIMADTGEVIDGVTAEIREPVFVVEMKGANE